jgi:hypothetical protein
MNQAIEGRTTASHRRHTREVPDPRKNRLKGRKSKQETAERPLYHFPREGSVGVVALLAASRVRGARTRVALEPPVRELTAHVKKPGKFSPALSGSARGARMNHRDDGTSGSARARLLREAQPAALAWQTYQRLFALTGGSEEIQVELLLRKIAAAGVLKVVASGSGSRARLTAACQPPRRQSHQRERRMREIRRFNSTGRGSKFCHRKQCSGAGGEESWLP